MKFVRISFALLCGTLQMAIAQTEFGINGYGRAILTNNNLSGNILNIKQNDTLSVRDTTSAKRGVSGYFLFDLTTKLKVNNDFAANAIMRVRTPYGAFFGQYTQFQFRQFQLMGRIGNNIKYQIGDIDIEATPYTVHNAQEIYHTFEADVFKNRRSILEYENFINGNVWRLQGIQGFAKYQFDKTIKQLDINIFGVRTNVTNDISNPDRILGGGRVKLAQSDFLTIGGTYVTLRDIQTNITQIDYANNVYTGDVKVALDNDAVRASVKAEVGASNYNYSALATNKTVSYNDYFFDIAAQGGLKSLKLGLTASYRDVGPQFSSPSAQTARMNVDRALGLFTNVYFNTQQRTQNLFDRYTDENIYNRNINPVLYNFLPQFGNVTPYGPATPNRRGFSFGLATDTSLKVVSAEVGVDVLSEILGEGIANLRKYTVVKGGAALHVNKLIGWEKRFILSAGIRNEGTKRDGLAPIDFSSTLIDAGLTIECIKNIDLMGGLKLLNAKGTEYRSTRDTYNLISTLPTKYEVNMSQLIYSLGARFRFTENSFFIVNYNVGNYNDGLKSDNSYLNNQLFLNYTLNL